MAAGITSDTAHDSVPTGPGTASLADWSTDAIYRDLRTLGVDTDRTRFADQILMSKDPESVRTLWKSRSKQLSLWDEFLLNAAAELQRRLTVDRPDLQSAVSALADAIDLLPANGLQASSDALATIIPAAMPLVEYLESFPSSERAEHYQLALGYANRDLTVTLREALRYCGGRYPDDTIRIGEAFSQGVPELAPTILPLVPAALFNAGRWREAYDRLGPCLERFSSHLPTLLTVGRIYDALQEGELALNAFRLGLERATSPAEWRVFRDRVVDLLERMGLESRWGYYEVLAPCPPETVSSNKRAHSKLKQRPALPPQAPAVVSEPFRAANRTGANDPCPCGSGKKYKRCCRG